METVPLYEEYSYSESHKFLVFPHKNKNFILRVEEYSPSTMMYEDFGEKEVITDSFTSALYLGRSLLATFDPM